ncbi:response regulator [Xylophilus rhododendri]|uniref:Response regulator n=1 Tax=Xylophilus rhododendri TaxID=2697032 RepID=A0A857JAU0_9BURK|nr:response regulator [Xylophilus rhododendri]QHJ00262.1 response regulator [Xylophilus rhododendri]
MKLRTYLIEDNAVIRENLLATLTELAAVEAIGTAETEHEAAAWLRSHNGNWDLAIVDLFLREGNGLNVLAALAQRAPHQKMVVLSNHATLEMRRRCESLGADAVFDKSTEIDALLDYCALQKARAERPH